MLPANYVGPRSPMQIQLTFIASWGLRISEISMKNLRQQDQYRRVIERPKIAYIKCPTQSVNKVTDSSQTYSPTCICKNLHMFNKSVIAFREKITIPDS